MAPLSANTCSDDPKLVFTPSERSEKEHLSRCNRGSFNGQESELVQRKLQYPNKTDKNSSSSEQSEMIEDQNPSHQQDACSDVALSFHHGSTHDAESSADSDVSGAMGLNWTAIKKKMHQSTLISQS